MGPYSRAVAKHGNRELSIQAAVCDQRQKIAEERLHFLTERARGLRIAIATGDDDVSVAAFQLEECADAARVRVYDLLTARFQLISAASKLGITGLADDITDALCDFVPEESEGA